MSPFWRSRYFIASAFLLLFGTGPLVAVIAAGLGLTMDPNPNPVGFGILSFLTFWPGIILMIVGFVRSRSRRV